MKADYETICAALLHDVVEDCDTTIEEIEKEFSPTIANLVDGVTKVSQLNDRDRAAKNIKTINKLVLSMDDDVRIIIIKLADRLDNMRTIDGHSDPEKKSRIAKQTIDIYAPTAALLGIYQMKEELEDRSFRTLKLNEYNEIGRMRSELLEGNESIKKALFSLQYQSSNDSLFKLLEGEGISVFDVKLKYKSLYGIYRILTSNNKSDISQTIDLVTYKVTTQGEDVGNLYRAMGIVNSKYKMLFDNQYAMKDYISNPKTELYKGLLTYNILKAEDDVMQIHFQYQTPSMLNMSVNGIASFWNYDDLEAVKNMQLFLKQMPIYHDLSRVVSEYKSDVYTYEEIFDELRKVVFPRRIYIKLPNYELIQTHEGITLGDFILSINEGFIDLNKDYYINGKKQSLKYILKNNDYFEAISKGENIITNIFGGTQRKRKE